jgi:hypothetical protein
MFPVFSLFAATALVVERETLAAALYVAAALMLHALATWSRP